MLNYYYQEENHRIGYAIIFLLFALCLAQVFSNVQSLFPQPERNISVVYEDNDNQRLLF